MNNSLPSSCYYFQKNSLCCHIKRTTHIARSVLFTLHHHYKSINLLNIKNSHILSMISVFCTLDIDESF